MENIDLFKTENPNRKIIIAKSGAGQAFYSEDIRLMVDNGDSYLTMVKLHLLNKLKLIKK